MEKYSAHVKNNKIRDGHLQLKTRKQLRDLFGPVDKKHFVNTQVESEIKATADEPIDIVLFVPFMYA